MSKFETIFTRRPQWILVAFIVCSFSSLFFPKFYENYNGKELSSDYNMCGINDFESLFNQPGVPKQSYDFSSHIVVTEDGYKLKIFRVHLKPAAISQLPKHQQKNKGRKVLVVHEFAGSSDSIFANGYKESYGFHLVDRGFDVWLINHRGNKYSSYEQNDFQSDKFYDYSFQEMGVYDQPATYKYIFNKANGGSEKIIVFGYSQGTSAIMAGLLDEKSGSYLTEKTEKFLAIAPIVYANHSSTQLHFLANLYLNNGFYTPRVRLIGFYQSLPAVCRQKVADKVKIAQSICFSNWITRALCNRIIPGVILNQESDSLLQNLHNISEYYPSGSNMRSVAHLGQLFIVPKDKYVFQKFDFGHDRNIIEYGEELKGKPATWDVSKIKTDVVILNGTEDNLANTPDTMALYDHLPENHRKIYWMDGWNHLTWNFATNAHPFREIIDKELLSDNESWAVEPLQ